ncbi:MAG: Gfo/Idh/MocA family oxidoreductase [Candidatus Omnitrophota bacterium]
MKIKVAVIGIGYLGTRHAQIYSKIPGAELSFICDINIEKAANLAKELNTKATSDFKEIIKNKVDAVSVVVPTNLHYKITQELLQNKIHCLVEKPITPCLKEAQKLINLAKKNNLILSVGHVERYNSAFVAVKKIIKDPCFIECHRLAPFSGRSLDISVILDLMIHDIDIALGLIKSSVKSIDAIGVKVLTNHEDIANARIKFNNGCICNLTASRISDEVMRKIRIFENDTYISLDYVKQEASYYHKENGQIKKENLPIEKEPPLERELKDFLSCITEQRNPLVSGVEARLALKTAFEIENKIRNAK